MHGILAQGAEELLIALQTPTVNGYVGIPALLWGKPGTGKSSFLDGLARPDFPVVSIIASIHDPTDFSGLPLLEGGYIRFAAPEWAARFDDAPAGGLLFIDELTTAPPAVQAALLRVVLERKIGQKQLPRNVRVAAAANAPEEIAGGWELSPPLCNRFLHIDWDLSGTAFADAMQEGFATAELPHLAPEAHHEATLYWRMMVAAFLRRNPALAHTRPGDGEFAFASPRTWEFAIQLAASCELLGKAARPGGKNTQNKVFLNLMSGCVGAAATTSLLGFLKNMRLPDPEKVLSGKENVDVASLQDDELYVLFCSMGSLILRQESGKSGSRLVDSTMRVLALVGTVAQNGRIDTVFAPLRQIVRGQVLQKAVVEAHQSGKLAKFQQAMKDNLQGDLAEYVGLVTKTSDRMGDSF